MSESEIEEYIIDTKEGKNHFNLRVSLYDNRIKLLITTAERPNKKYYNLVRLSQLKEACNAFEKISTIKSALIIIKNNIEQGNIMISEENIDVIDIKFVLKINGKNYSPFVIGLPIDDDDINNELPVQKKEAADTNQKNNQNNQNKNMEILPTTFDYQGNKEAEMKYGQSTKSTTEYINPIIKSDVKEPNLILEYIEPILQVHYPDGTTKSTALPARLQTEDGKEPNIAPEQLKNIHEQIYKNFNKSALEYEKEKNRANSVSKKNPVNELPRQTFNVQNSLNNLNNLHNLTPNFKSFNNNEINSNTSSNDINAVRSAMKPNINMNINMNTMNNYNIRQVKTQFNPYDNVEERNTTGRITNNINNININMPLSPRDNYMNFRQNKLINKGLSDYSISSVPNKPLLMSNLANINNYNNYNIISNTPMKTSQSNNNSPLIQEVPSQNNNIINNYNNYNNIIMLQKGLNKSSSSPAMSTLNNVNRNFYQQNQSQTAYFYRQNNFNNLNSLNNINTFLPQSQNLQNQINSVNLQMSDSKINNSHTSFMNYTHNPHLIKNSQSYNFSTSSGNNTLTRNYSNQNSFLSYRTMNPLTQSNDEIRYQQLMNQKRLQEQQRLQLLQRTKMNNINYNTLNNINYNTNNNVNTNTNNNSNYMNLNNNNNISRNPNLIYNNDISNESKNKKEINYAQVNILNQLVRSNNNNQVRTFEIQNSKNTQPMNNLRNKTNLNNHLNNTNNTNNTNQMRNIELNNNSSLKQSHSQQIIRNTPSMKNEITAQQIALAEMASLQNQQNPNNFKANLVSLNQKFLDSSGNEETQSQFERESNNQPQIKDPNLKIEKENLKEKENIITETPSENNINQNINNININNSPNKTQLTPQSQIPESTQQEEEEDDEEDPEAEKLFRLETGLIIFRNGLLRGIIHKYKEIDDVVSKIQLKLMAGVKFMLLYRASVDGDKAKIFHQKCDKHNMTLVLVETTKGVRFGGFTTKTWDGNCAKKIDNNAFVFSFDKRKCYDIIKNENAIGGYPKFGPVFFGCQIRIYDNFFTKGGTTCNRGLNYKTKEDYELNNGEQKYIVKEIEVYDIEAIEV